MLSKATQRWLRSLSQKKVREREGLFVAEGPKVVGEFLRAGFECVFMVTIQPEPFGQDVGGGSWPVEVVTPDELQRLSSQQAPQGVIGVFRMPVRSTGDDTAAAQGMGLLLDDVQDPGNVGTIIRLADWFGVEEVYLTAGCADAWSAKVVQASMGALARVRVHVGAAAERVVRAFLRAGRPVYATVLGGDNIYKGKLAAEGLVVMGNEGQGIHAAIVALCTHRLTIPSYPPGRPTSESLNVAMATGIILSELRRQQGGAACRGR